MKMATVLFVVSTALSYPVAAIPPAPPPSANPMIWQVTRSCTELYVDTVFLNDFDFTITSPRKMDASAVLASGQVFKVVLRPDEPSVELAAHSFTRSVRYKAAIPDDFIGSGKLSVGGLPDILFSLVTQKSCSGAR